MSRKFPNKTSIARNTEYRLAMMIANGIGAHDFSEGLVIGQSYVSGAIGLAVILIIGLGLVVISY
jgi:zinc transporter, ZIP family